MGKRVLLVDEDESVLRHLRLALRAREWDVTTALSLAEAESGFAGSPSPVVVAEMHLTPLRKSEGLDLLRRVKELRPQTHFVVITGFVSPEGEQAALEAGADAVISKPFELRPFLDRLDGFCVPSSDVRGNLP